MAALSPRRHFIIKTDHSSLKYFLGQRANTPFQQKWVSKLLGFDYEIQYKRGAENLVVDALSKVHVSEGKNTDDGTVELSAISYPYFGWIDELRRHNEKDEWVKEKFKEVSDCISRGNTPPSLAKYSIDNGFLCYKRIVVLSPSSQWKHKILEEHHSTPVAGHQGVVKAYHQIKKGFYWQGLKKDVEVFISECVVCQQNKFETISSPGLLQPLPISQQVWHDVSMDFIVGLPNYHGKTVIMVVVDRLTKYAHFIALSHPYTTTSVAQVFIDNVLKLHGLPSSIMSDRDLIFVSAFWKELFKLQGTKLCMSPGYHPQSDGQSEVMNRCLEIYLRCFVGRQP